MKPLILLGAGGHSKVVRDCVQAQGKYTIMAVLDDRYSSFWREAGIVHGPLRMLESLGDRDCVSFFIAIGSNEARKRILGDYGLEEARFARIIHPEAIVSPSARIGRGTAVMPRAVINADAEIGRHSIINTAAVVEHDCRIGNFAHIAPHATLTGAVRVGDGAQVGAGASVIPGIKIGSGAVVGAGSAVIRDIPAGITAAGNPAKEIKSKG